MPRRTPPPRMAQDTPRPGDGRVLGRGPHAMQRPARAFFRAAIEGLTPYQPGKPVEDVQRELGLERVIKLASNEGPFGPFPAAREAMERAAARAEPLPGRRRLRLHAALAERHGVAPEEICVGAGADGCIDMLSQAILDPGDEVVCGWPSFPSYLIYARKQGATVVTVPLTEHRYDLDALLEAVTAAHEARLHLPPEQPDGDDEHRRRARRVLRARARARAHGRRSGVLRVHRPCRLSRRGRALPEGRAAASSCCARSRRSTGWPACASATRSGRERSVRGDGEGAPSVRPDDARAGRGAREHRRRRRARAPSRGQRDRPRAPRGSGARARPRSRSRRSATSSSSRRARTRTFSSSGCCARA